MVTNTDPSTPSSAYRRMEPIWCMIGDIIAGPKKIREADKRYLPKYEAESEKEYCRRLDAAPWRPEFVDALESLASKPFGKEVTIAKGASAKLKSLAEDIDARGNNLTAFSREIFKGGIAKGMHAILVDFPSMSPGITLDAERSAKPRPYWVSIPADEIIALYTEFVGSREIITHVRLKECAVVRDGFDEVFVERVRIIEPGRWELWEQYTAENGESSFQKIAEGSMTLPLVPLAIFWTGERKGSQEVKPPLLDLADMQIELYRKLSRQDEIETYAGSPMLQAQGMAAPDTDLPVGPKTILYAPPSQDGGSSLPGYSYVSPDASLITEIREGVKQVIDDMRRLGMQPMTQKSGSVTATATSVEAAKAHSVVEAWALGLKDVLEQAFVFTAEWLGEANTVEVDVNTDFSVEQNAQAPLTALKDARASGDLGHRDYLYGLRRFGVLPPDADLDKIAQDAVDEQPSPDSEADITAALIPSKPVQQTVQ